MVKQILGKYPYRFYAFGSRVKGTMRKFSDLDLCFKDAISLSEQSRILEDFEESDLPFRVDLLDWNKIDERFRQYIADDLELIV